MDLNLDMGNIDSSYQFAKGFFGNTPNVPDTEAANGYSAELKLIYYCTENDELELQQLLASWNLDSLFEFFKRKFFLYNHLYMLDFYHNIFPMSKNVF